MVRTKVLVDQKLYDVVCVLLEMDVQDILLTTVLYVYSQISWRHIRCQWVRAVGRRSPSGHLQSDQICLDYYLLVLLTYRLLISGVGEVLVQQFHDGLAERAGQVISWRWCLAGGQSEEEGEEEK